MSSLSLRCWTEVSRAQLAANFRAIRDTVGPAVEVMPIVKADAYHHGAVEVARLLTAEGAASFGVASAEEGAELRAAGIAARIVVLSDFIPADRPTLVECDLTPAISDLDALRDWDRLGREAGRSLPYHLKIDSGFGRLGTCAAAAEILRAIADATHTRLAGLMTHFASAGDYTSTQTDEQTAHFLAVAAHLREAGIEPRYIHMASSIPIVHGRRETWGTMVRPGISLYGYVPPPKGNAPAATLSVKPALTWKATVLLVKDVPAGAPIGYNALFRAPAPMRIAVVSAGYADGVAHRLSNRGHVIAKGKLVPMLGAVSMDVLTIDATSCPDLQAGDAVTLLGTEGDVTLDAQAIAETAGTISYTILCNISARVRRVYA